MTKLLHYVNTIYRSQDQIVKVSLLLTQIDLRGKYYLLIVRLLSYKFGRLQILVLLYLENLDYLDHLLYLGDLDFPELQ